jgi:hypothetical protein
MANSEVLKVRKGTFSAVTAFVALLYEQILDTTRHVLVIGDGATVGGFPMESGGYIRTPAGDYTGLANDSVVLMNDGHRYTHPLTLPVGKKIYVFKNSDASSNIPISNGTADGDWITNPPNGFRRDGRMVWTDGINVYTTNYQG